MLRSTLTLLSLVFLGLLVLHSQPQDDQTIYMSFSKYKKLYNLHFESTFEEKYRNTIYNDNMASIMKHNLLKDRSYQQGINQFTYLTNEEFKLVYLGYSAPSQSPSAQVDQTYIESNQFDWTTKGAVTHVKNQGACGSCWAFSTTGSLEGLSKLSGGSLQSFSEQQLIDCSSSYGNMGCNGGSMESALKYVRANGITTQTAYPYKAIKGVCLSNMGSFKIASYISVPGCTALTSALLHGPVSVAVDATNWSNYRSGVFSGCGTNLNHGVLLTGISNQYWRLKNSWGQSWGEAGFIRIARGNTCGVCTQCFYPNK